MPERGRWQLPCGVHAPLHYERCPGPLAVFPTLTFFLDSLAPALSIVLGAQGSGSWGSSLSL